MGKKTPNSMFLFQKGKEWDLGNSRLVSLTLISGKVMEQLIPERISMHRKDKKVIQNSYRGFTEEIMLTQSDSFLK